MIRLLRFVCISLLIGLTLGVGGVNAAAAPDAAPNGGWVEVGSGSASRGAGISQNLGSSANPALAIGSDGTAIVAWEDTSNGNKEIYVRRWNGSGWVEMGPGSASGGGISGTASRSTDPTLAVAADGRPVVAWMESEGEYSPGKIYVKGWDGSAWVEMGAGSASGDGISNNEESGAHSPSLAIGPDNMPIIAWSEALAGKGGVFIKKWTGSAWEELGSGSASGDGISDGLELSSTPSLAVSPDGKPIVAWSGNSSLGWDIYVRRWNGLAWVEMGAGSASVGGISNNRTDSNSPTLAIGPNGAPVVAWQDEFEYQPRVYVRRWNGSAWEEMGAGSATTVGIDTEGDYAASPSLAIGPDNAPVVAWESALRYPAFVKRWNGMTWVEVGAGLASGDDIRASQGNAQRPSLAIGPDSRPVLAWQDSVDGTPEIYLRQWQGSAWAEMGVNSASAHGGISSTGKASTPSLAVGPDGQPVIAWQDNSSGNWEIYVKRWNGLSWVEMGAGSASGGGISQNASNSQTPSLAIGPDGAIVVAWRDDYDYYKNGIYVRRWDGSAWVEMGAGSASGLGISNISGESNSPSLVIGPDGVPVLAWSVRSDTHNDPPNIFIKRWDGSAWVEMGAGSASGGGVDNTMANSNTPSLAIGPDNMPVVAWSEIIDPSSNQWDIYIKRWNGLAWTEVGAGSAAGGGISNSPNASLTPALTVGSDGKPVVAWQETIYKDHVGMTAAIYVRRWNGAIWEEVGAGSASGDGISLNPEGAPASDPSLAIGPGGGPVVAWNVRYSLWYSEENIYVKQWNGSAWVEMDEGSATGRGIGDDPGDSKYPSLATGPNKLPVVAWVNSYSHSDEIYVRRYPPACHALTLTHTGQGGDPAASPANSADCPNGRYNAGESITLIASPAPGSIVSGWSGTNNNSSTAAINALIMPDANHTVGVSYREFQATNWIYTPAAFK